MRRCEPLSAVACWLITGRYESLCSYAYSTQDELRTSAWLVQRAGELHCRSSWRIWHQGWPASCLLPFGE